MSLAFVYSYFENPGMLKHQQKIWSKYQNKYQDRLEIIVTDDCSENVPLTASMINQDQKYKISAFRIMKKIPWNWLEARNIGAKYTKAEWLLLTDMDHVIAKPDFEKIMHRLHRMNTKYVYQFNRVLAPDNSPYHFHNDSFLVAKKLFWKCGGYDEDYAGNYGTSGMFRRRLLMASEGNVLLDDIYLTLYPRSVIPDASTISLPRKEGRDPAAIKKITEWKTKNKRKIQNFLQPYERII